MPLHGVHLSHWQRAKMELLLQGGVDNEAIAEYSGCSRRSAQRNRKKWAITGSLEVKQSYAGRQLMKPYHEEVRYFSLPCLYVR